MRIFNLGLGRLSNRGHAPFLAKEIEELLRKSDGNSYTSKHIGNEIDRLALSGYLSPRSNIRCLVYPMELIGLKTDKKNAAICTQHGTHSSWSASNNDWAPDYLPETSVRELIIPADDEDSDSSDLDWEITQSGDGTYGS